MRTASVPVPRSASQQSNGEAAKPAQATGNAADASAQYEYLAKYRGTMLYGGLGAVDRMLALICMVSGRFDDAADHFQTCHDYGSLLLIRDQQGDREKAASIVDQGLWLTEELGMKNLKNSFHTQKELTRAYAAS